MARTKDGTPRAVIVAREDALKKIRGAIQDEMGLKGKTQAELAKTLGITGPRMSNLMSERYELFSFEAAATYALRLKIPLVIALGVKR